MGTLWEAVDRLVGYEVDWSATGSWAQAFFTVGAIWAAGRFSHKDRLERRVEAMEAFHGVAQSVRDLIHTAAREAEDFIMGGSVGREWTARFEDLEVMLRSVPVFELGASKGARMIADLLVDVRAMKTLMTTASRNASQPNWIVQVRLTHRSAEDHASKVAEWLEGRKDKAVRWLWINSRNV